MILTPFIDIDNLDPTNGIYLFKPLWSLMTKGEKNKDISTWGEIVYKDRVKRQQRGREIKI